MKKHDIWLEITTLIIPGKNDSKDELTAIADFISKELGSDTPWHISSFHPDYQMTGVSETPADTLVKAYEIGKEAGIDYVYVGNAMIDKGRDTECPNCGEVLIRRKWFEVSENKIDKGKCPKCRNKIAGYF
jgi:pyruvate formate lyase activating enzyme